MTARQQEMSAAQILRLIGTDRLVKYPSAIYGAALSQAVLSYSQAGEDIAVAKMLKHRILDKARGSYVDIGCGLPFQISNTFLYYCFGWRGLCVDANQDHAPHWAQHRPNDTFVCSAVGDVEGSTLLFKHTSSNWGMATIGATPPDGSYHAGVPVSVRRLDNLFAEHLPDDHIDFMTIDVEGAELGVLNSNDWNRWRPEVILMECHAFNLETPFDAPTVRFLRDHGYCIEGKIGANVLMKRIA